MARVVAAPALTRQVRAGRTRGIVEIVWIIGVLVIAVIGACVAAIFLGGGEQGPFVAISKFGGRRHGDHYQDDLRKPPNENELL